MRKSKEYSFTGNKENVLNWVMRSQQMVDAFIPPHISALVLEGGGVKGLAYCGALQVLHEKNVLMHVKSFAGASAGAITAAALALGYTPAEITALMHRTPFAAFVDDKVGVIRDAWSLLHNYGMCPGAKLLTFLEDLVAAKANNRRDYTFAQLFAERGVTLVVNATDVRRGKTVYFTPSSDVPIAQAVRASASVPFLFTPVALGDALLVDGGLLDNYPLHVFDGSGLCDPAARRAGTDIKQPRTTLGLKLVTAAEDTRTDAVLADAVPIHGLFDFAHAVMECPLLQAERAQMSPAYWPRTLPICVADIPVTQFRLTDAQVAGLMDAGRVAAESWLATRQYLTTL